MSSSASLHSRPARSWARVTESGLEHGVGDLAGIIGTQSCMHWKHGRKGVQRKDLGFTGSDKC